MFKGHLETISIITILQILSEERKTGVLIAQCNDHQVKFFIQDGFILYVSGTFQKTRLDCLLRNSDLIDEEHLSDCIRKSKEKNKTLGKVLIEKGYLSFEAHEALASRQAEEIVFNLLSWKNGSFEYRDASFNVNKMVIAPINIMGLILEALRRKDELQYEKQESSDCTDVQSSSEHESSGKKAGSEKVDKKDEIDLSQNELDIFWQDGIPPIKNPNKVLEEAFNSVELTDDEKAELKSIISKRSAILTENK